jgi:hypothetical protein
MQITKNFFESKTGKSILSMNIRNKISITSAILLALCLLFFTSLITYDQKKKNYKELELNAERITDLIAYTNTENLLNLNYGGLKKNSDYFFKDNDKIEVTFSIDHYSGDFSLFKLKQERLEKLKRLNQISNGKSK